MPHTNEVHGLPGIEGEPEYPGDVVTEGLAENLCGDDVFTDYVGVSYLSSQYSCSTLRPSEAAGRR